MITNIRDGVYIFAPLFTALAFVLIIAHGAQIDNPAVDALIYKLLPRALARYRCCTILDSHFA